jgi:O-antigen/teichoic acid export membrane protein
VAQLRASGEAERARGLVATAVGLQVCMGLLLIGVFALLAPVFATVFQVPEEERAAVPWLVVVAGCGVGLSLPSRLLNAILSGLHRFDLVNAIAVAASLVSIGATVVILVLGGGVMELLLLRIVLLLCVQIACMLLIRRVAPELRFGWRDASRAFVRPVITHSAWIFIVQVAGRLQLKSDEVVIGAFLPVAAVTPYTFANKLAVAPQSLADQFLKVLLPMASELHGGQDRPALRSLFLTSTRVTLGVVTPVASVLATVAGAVLSLWVGPAYADAAPLVTILTAASAVSTALWPAGAVLQGISRHQPLAFMALGNGVANLVLSILLLPRLGLMGVALGTLIPFLVESLIVLAYTLRVLEVSVSELIQRVMLPALLPAVPTIMLEELLVSRVEPSSWPAVIVVSGVGMGVYAAGYLSFGACDVERRLCRDQLTTLVRRLRPRPA